MVKVNLVVLIGFVVCLQKVNAELPKVPKTPSWKKLQIEKPRSSVIPSWYDVLVSPQILKPENETNSKPDKVSYANLRDTFSLNELNLPDVVQKNVVLEAEELVIPDENPKDTKPKPKSGTKMKDLFKNSFITSKKDLKKTALKVEVESTAAKPKDSMTQKPVTNKEKVPLYFPIFRPQTNGRKRKQRILEKPDFRDKERLIKDNEENYVNIESNLRETPINLVQDRDLKILYENSRGKQLNVGNETSNESSQRALADKTIKDQLITVKPGKSQETIEQNDLLNFLLQAIKNGDLKLDTTAKSSSKPFQQMEKTFQQMTSIPNELVKEISLQESPKLIHVPINMKENTNMQYQQQAIQMPHVIRYKNPENVNFIQDQKPNQHVFHINNHEREVSVPEHQAQEHAFQNNNPANRNSDQEFRTHRPQIELVFRDNKPEILNHNQELVLRNTNFNQEIQNKGPRQHALWNIKPQNVIPKPEYQNIVPNHVNFANRDNTHFQKAQIQVPNQKIAEDAKCPKENCNPTLTLYKPDTVSLWETYGDFMKEFTMTVLVPIYTEKLMGNNT